MLERPVDLLAVFRSLQTSENPACLLSAELRIVRTNGAWTTFARANRGEALLARWGRGVQLLDAVPADLRSFYRRGFERALATGEAWSHDYECSSDEVFRLFRMTAFPIGASFLVLDHALRVERPHDREPRPAAEATYRSGGLMLMCSHCRRLHVPGSSQRWDWVPAYVAEMPPDVSHGLCPPCARFYYPAD